MQQRRQGSFGGLRCRRGNARTSSTGSRSDDRNQVGANTCRRRLLRSGGRAYRTRGYGALGSAQWIPFGHRVSPRQRQPRAADPRSPGIPTSCLPIIRSVAPRSNTPSPCRASMTTFASRMRWPEWSGASSSVIPAMVPEQSRSVTPPAATGSRFPKSRRRHFRRSPRSCKKERSMPDEACREIAGTSPFQ